MHSCSIASWRKPELSTFRQSNHCFLPGDYRVAPTVVRVIAQTDSTDFTFADFQKQLLQFGQKWLKVFQAISREFQHDNGDGELRMFCWKARLRSTVTNASNCDCALDSSSPFLIPAHPA